MPKKNKIFLVVIILLFTALVVVQHFVPRPVNWRLSFSCNQKSPFGCSVAKNLLQVLFPEKEITVNTASLYMNLPKDTLANKNLIIITDEFEPDSLDLSSLLDFAANGNSVLISSLSFSDKLCDTLQFKTNIRIFDTTGFNSVKESLRLSFLSRGSDSVFFYSKRMPQSWFTSYDTLRSIPMGSDRSAKVNFILIQFGKGKIFLQCQPLAFTNYHLLYGNHRYASAALSFLPGDNIIWDQYYKPDKVLDFSPVRYILSQPALRSAYFLSLTTILIFMTLGSRRMQRIIPVIQPVQNTSLEFVKTVGKLYYRSMNHTDLARKKLIYFNEFIRTRYSLQGLDKNDQQIQILSQKSGMEEGKIRMLLQRALRVSGKQQLESYELIELHKLIEDFYKHCK
jgi:hypothetical protein